MKDHLGKQHSSVTLERRCQSALRAHVRPQSPGNASYLQESPRTLRAQGLLPPCIWPFLNKPQQPMIWTGA
jgi:hypothetical protein